MTGMTCTRCRTEDPSRSSSSLPPPLVAPFFRSRLSSVDPLSSSLRRARSGYLLRGRCGLNLINSMRHLDKCAPRTRIQRIIFILIHLPLPSISGLSFPPLRPDPSPRSLVFLLVRRLASRSPRFRTLEPFLRLSDPRFILVKREHAARGGEGWRVGGQERKKGRIYPLPSRRDHLSF